MEVFLVNLEETKENIREWGLNFTRQGILSFSMGSLRSPTPCSRKGEAHPSGPAAEEEGAPILSRVPCAHAHTELG